MATLIGIMVPWWLKVAGKLVLARFPVSYKTWRASNLFKHGDMLNPQYVLQVFCRHYLQVKPFLPEAYSALELGPGDSLATAVVAAAHGANRIFLVDVGRFASTDIQFYVELARFLHTNAELQMVTPNYNTVSQMLEATHTTYLTEGLTSLRTIPSNSVDFIFSHAVLEHIALNEIANTIQELHRIQPSGGVGSHRIDLEDHLGHSLNSLRFPRKIWESDLFHNSGFYTNRLRANQIVDIFVRAGYSIISRKDDRWPTLPVSHSKLHEDYANLPTDELCIRGMDLLVQKR